MGAAIGAALQAAGHEVLWASDGRSEATRDALERSRTPAPSPSSSRGATSCSRSSRRMPHSSSPGRCRRSPGSSSTRTPCRRRRRRGSVRRSSGSWTAASSAARRRHALSVRRGGAAAWQSSSAGIAGRGAGRRECICAQVRVRRVDEGIGRAPARDSRRAPAHLGAARARMGALAAGARRAARRCGALRRARAGAGSARWRRSRPRSARTACRPASTRRPPRSIAAADRSRSTLGTVPGTRSDASLLQRVCGKPRSTFDVAGSGQREVTTLPRV